MPVAYKIGTTVSSSATSYMCTWHHDQLENIVCFPLKLSDPIESSYLRLEADGCLVHWKLPCLPDACPELNPEYQLQPHNHNRPEGCGHYPSILGQ